jgi:taurine dioxygenase
MAHLQVRRLGFALGAEVTGIDLRQSLDDATIAEIRMAWLEHLVLCFPNQTLSRHEFVTFAGRFGPLDDNRFVMKNRDADTPYIRLLTNKPVAGKPWDGYTEGQSWHSDLSHTERPSPGSFLLAKEVPDIGGDTIFANMYMAYETLSPTFQKMIEPLSAVFDLTLWPNNKNRTDPLVDAVLKKRPPVVQSIVRTHPETGRKALFLDQSKMRCIVGATEEESRPILDFLNRHATTYEFTYRHQWAVNDLMMWDNRCLLHLAGSDYDMQRQPREIWRCGLYGPKEGRLYTADAELEHAG